ncbi:MAG: MFS transporter, partial [Acidimicrobiales bacterium]
LYPAFGPSRIMVGGPLVLAGALALMSLVGADTNLWWMRLLIFVTGFGMSGVFVPTQAAGFATITPAATARASTVFNGFRYLGGAIGVAILTTVLAAVGLLHLVGGHAVSNLAAYHTAFLAGAGIAVLGAAVSLTVSDYEARDTMVRRGKR